MNIALSSSSSLLFDHPDGFIHLLSSCRVSVVAAVLCQELSTAELHAVYRWIDQLPLTKPKKNIARDFSDAGNTTSTRTQQTSQALPADTARAAHGQHMPTVTLTSPALHLPLVLSVLLSEVLHHYHPKLVDLHNYSPALSLATKRTNWQTLNHKVLKKLHYPPLTDSHIQQLVAGQKGAIERLLWGIKRRAEEGGVVGDERGRGGRREEKEWFAGGGSASGAGVDVEDELVMTSDGRVQQVSLGGAASSGRDGSGNSAERSKDALIADQRDVIEVLHDRIAKLEQLLQLVHSSLAQLP